MEFAMLFGPAYVVILSVFLWMRYAGPVLENDAAPASGPGAALTLAAFLIGAPLAGDMLNAFTIQSNIRSATSSMDRDAIRALARPSSRDAREGRDQPGDRPDKAAPEAPGFDLREMAETRRALRNSNMRAAPGTHNPVVGRLDKGETVLVIASAEDPDGDLWYLAAPDGDEEPAFVYSELLVTGDAYAAANPNPKTFICDVWDIHNGRYRSRIFRVRSLSRGKARGVVSSEIPGVVRMTCQRE